MIIQAWKSITGVQWLNGQPVMWQQVGPGAWPQGNNLFSSTGLMPHWHCHSLLDRTGLVQKDEGSNEKKADGNKKAVAGPSDGSKVPFSLSLACKVAVSGKFN